MSMTMRFPFNLDLVASNLPDPVVAINFLGLLQTVKPPAGRILRDAEQFVFVCDKVSLRQVPLRVLDDPPFGVDAVDHLLPRFTERWTKRCRCWILGRFCRVRRRPSRCRATPLLRCR